LKFGRATFSNENWQKNIKLIEFENWLILPIDQGTYSKILMNNRNLKIHKDKEFSPLELRDDKTWKLKHKDIPAWVYTGKSIIDFIVENRLYVDYEYRIGLYEPFEFYNQTVEYEMNVENGEFMTKKIFERKRIKNNDLPTPYKINCFGSDLFRKVLTDFLFSYYLLTLVLKHSKKSCTTTLAAMKPLWK
jgi:hypothetical protein